MFFFLLVMRARARQLFSQNSSYLLWYPRSPHPHPHPPAPCLKKKLKLKIKKIQKKERKENQWQAYLRWNPFSDFASFDPNFKNPSPDFPIEYAGPSIFRS